MTPYEIQSIAIAQQQLSAYWWADRIAAAALLAVLIGAVLAYKSLRASQWNTLLSFEQDMATRRANFHKVAAMMNENPDLSNVFLKLLLDEAKETYFNSLDRLASSILKGHFPDKTMKLDYQESITRVVREFKDDFGTSTEYRNVLKLYNKWQDQV